MVTKTYECKSCGQFNHEFETTSEKIDKCPNCNNPVTRVYKPIHYTDCIGFCGRSYIKG